MTIAEKLQVIAENESKIYEAGKKAEYDKFWDSYQNYGKRTKYEYGFPGEGWNDENFKPKYDMILGAGYSATNMFWGCKIINLKKCLDDCGVKLDTGNATQFAGVFQNSYVEVLPIINLSSASGNTGYSFLSTKIKTIEKLIFSEITNINSNMFQSSLDIENIVFDGVIAMPINLQWQTKLTKDTIISLINTLSSATSDLTATLNQTAVQNAFETSAGAADGNTSQEWKDLIATKSNWTISSI